MQTVFLTELVVGISANPFDKSHEKQQQQQETRDSIIDKNEHGKLFYTSAVRLCRPDHLIINNAPALVVEGEIEHALSLTLPTHTDNNIHNFSK